MRCRWKRLGINFRRASARYCNLYLRTTSREQTCFRWLWEPLMRHALFLVVVSLSATAVAQPARPGTFTDAAEAGIDYVLQGEYAGSLFIPGYGFEPAGLQVVALGDGKFDAVCYRGGLPGVGWDRATKAGCSGQAAAGRLTLSGPAGEFIVDGTRALSFDAAGRLLGRLSKVERISPTMSLAPPPGAIVLFGGGSTEQLQSAKITPDGLLMAGVLTKMPVG